MQPIVHIMGSFLSDLIPPLSISSSSFSLRSVVPFFSRLPLSIYLLSLSSLHLFSDSPSSPHFHPLHFHILICLLILPFIHPTTRFPRSWLTGSFIPSRGHHIAPSWMCVRSKRGDVPRGVHEWVCTSSVTVLSDVNSGLNRYQQSYPRVANLVTPLLCVCTGPSESIRTLTHFLSVLAPTDTRL